MLKTIKNDLPNIVIGAIFIAIIGGVISWLLGMGLGPIAASGGIGSIIISIIGIALLVGVAAWSKLDNWKWYDALVMFLTIFVLGEAIATSIPSVAPFILNTVNFAPSSLVWTFVYIAFAEVIVGKIRKKR